MSEENREKKIPAVGQRWRDNDKRFPDREVVLIKQTTKDDHAAFACDVYDDGVKKRQTVIRAARFKPTATGYRYVGEGVPRRLTKNN